jgi:hypothetical protein
MGGLLDQVGQVVVTALGREFDEVHPVATHLLDVDVRTELMKSGVIPYIPKLLKYKN